MVAVWQQKYFSLCFNDILCLNYFPLNSDSEDSTVQLKIISKRSEKIFDERKYCCALFIELFRQGNTRSTNVRVKALKPELKKTLLPLRKLTVTYN